MTRNPANGRTAMIDVLRETLELVSRSPHEGWPDEQPEECAGVLSDMVEHLEDPSAPCPEYSTIQFAPTGPIQEIAMANGWHDRYMELAEGFDQLQAEGHWFG